MSNPQQAQTSRPLNPAIDPWPKAPLSLRREGRFILIAFALIYALTCSGDMVGDSEVRWLIAKQLVDQGTVALPSGSYLTAQGPDGRSFSWYGVGQPLCFIPFLLIGRLLASVLPISASGDMLGQFIVSLTFFPIVGALGVWVMHRIAWHISQSARIARWMALIFGLGTMHWFYAVLAYEQSQIALLQLSGCLLLMLYNNRRSQRYLFGGLGVLGLALIFRPAESVTLAVIWCLGLGVDLLSRDGKSELIARIGRWIVAGLVCVGPSAAWMFYYNHLRWGSIFDTGNSAGGQITGFGADPWATPLIEGLSGMLFSPGKGLLVYNPLLTAGLFGLVFVWRGRGRLASVVALGVIAVSLLIHAKLAFWSGGGAWGPRYQASMVGFACLGLIPLLHRGVAWRAVVMGLFAASVVIQSASTVFNFSLEYVQKPEHGTAPGPYIWQWDQSHLTLRFANIADKIAGRSLLDQANEDKSTSIITALNYFPFKARAVLGGGAIFKLMLALWCGLWGALIVCIVLWRRWASEERGDGRALAAH